MQISEPGLYPDVPEADYHGDPCPAPSLSSSICKLIVSRSPLHAWYEHPRLRPTRADEPEKFSRAKIIGTAAHKMLLGKGRDIVEIAAEDYKTKGAQQARDAALAAGKTPMLSDDMASVRTLVEAARDGISGTELAGAFNEGAAELTGVCRDQFGNWRRIRVDWLPAASMKGGHILAVDVKTTATSAAPEDWQRTAFDMGYDIQAAFYSEVLAALLPDVRTVAFKFLTIEQEPPYGVTVNEFSGQAQFEATELVELGSRMWAECLRRGEWPGYPRETTHMDPPKWRSERAEIRKLAMFRRIEAWQRPLDQTDKPLLLDKRTEAA